MPVQTGKSSLLAKLGARGAQVLNEHKAKEPELPNMGLPAGIDNAIAQVVDCKFGTVQDGKTNAGAIFFFAAAVVKKPKEFGGVTIAGQRTQIMKLISDPKGVVNDKNLVWAQDQLKMLVGRGANPEMFTIERMEATAAMILKAKPHTCFRTWKGDKQDVKQVNGKWFLCNLNEDGSVKKIVEGKGPYASEEFARKANPYAGRDPMVNHQWGGVVEYHEEAGPDVGAVSYNGQSRIDHDAAASGLPSGVESSVASPGEEAGEETTQFNEFEGGGENSESSDSAESSVDWEEDLDSLATASYNDAAAQARLVEIARGAGMSDDEINSTEKWEDVVASIQAARGSEDGEESTEPEAWKPTKGEVVFYNPKVNGKPQLGKNKKPLKVEVEVLSVNIAAQTATVKDLTTKKPLLGSNKKPLEISWDDLSEE